MHIFTEITLLQLHLRIEKKTGKNIGFVPTMGALHLGHLSLITRAKKDCDLVVCSIYVNPAQFNNSSDLEKYPRTLEADKYLLEKAGCDIIFAPTDQSMYPQPVKIKFDFGYLETVMEGKYRSGHFNGVGIVVSKLFHIVMPDIAYFGQKDLQQFAIISQLVSDLSFTIQLVCCPITRETDGLAMSSRNVRLTDTQRKIAPILYQTLQKAKEWVLLMPIMQVKFAVQDHLANVPDLRLEYFEIVDSLTLQPVQEALLDQQISLCIAAYLGDIRLIDNVFLTEII